MLPMEARTTFRYRDLGNCILWTMQAHETIGNINDSIYILHWCEIEDGNTTKHLVIMKDETLNSREYNSGSS